MADRMKWTDDITATLDRMVSAESRYGEFASTHEALGVALEEWDELRAAVKANALGSVEMEALDLAAVLIRLAHLMRTSEYTHQRGENPEPVAGHLDLFIGEDSPKMGSDTVRNSINIWQRYASPVWMDINPSDTLQFRSARENDDERHICPLQLDVIRRGMQLWTNPGDLVLDPFMGIGSTGAVAIEMGRAFVGFELKQSYYECAVKNLIQTEQATKTKSAGLFSEETVTQ